MPYLGEIAALGAAFLWSFSSFVFTSAVAKIGAVKLNIARMGLAALLLLLTMPLLGLSFNITPYQLIFLSLSGFVGLVIGDSYLFKGFQEIGPRYTMLIMSINPAIAAAIAFFTLGESLSLYGIIGIAITLGGVSLVVLEKSNGNSSRFKITRKGLLYGLLAAAGQGVGLIFAKLAYKDGDINGLVATFYRISSALVILIPLAVMAGRLKNPLKYFAMDKRSFGLVFLGSIIGPYLGITFSFIAIIYTKVGIASTLMSTVPVVMLPLTWLFYKERLSFKSIIGAFITVAGVAVLFLI